MSATVEHIRQEIDRLAPEEIQELFADLQHEYPFRLIHLDQSAPDLTKLSEADRIKLDALRRDIQEAANSLDRGEGREIDWEAFLAERHQAYEARKSS